MRLSSGQLHLRLANYYAGYYSVLGAMLPYFALWLAGRDFTPVQIGIVLGVHGGMRLFMPVFWGWVADRSGRRAHLIRLATLASLLIFLAAPFSHSFVAMLLLIIVFALAWNATMPQFEALTLSHIAVTGGDYSRIRLWGSIGFVMVVVGLGQLFDLISLEWLPWIMLAFMAWMSLTAWLIPDAPSHPAQQPQSIGLWQTLRRPVVIALLAVCCLSQMSFAPYYGFFSLYLEYHGYPKSITGLLWAFGVVVEIWVFLYTGRLIQRYGGHIMMTLALASTALRWGLLPITIEFMPGLLLLQALHLSSFGIFHACAIHFLQRLFPAQLQGRGQALYVAMGFGLGGSLGALLSGPIWQWVSPDAVYYFACGAATLGTFIAWRFLSDTRS